jgi:hypothetical protein
MKRLALAAVFLAGAAFCQTGKVQGNVNDDSGRPVVGAYAVAYPQGPNSRFSRTSVTGAKGEYTFDNLPAGKYSVCVQFPGAPHLNPCRWSTPMQFTVAGGQTISNQNVPVVLGTVLAVQVADPKQLITAQDDLLVGIYTPSGLFQPMRLAAQSSTGRTYDIAVPKNTSVKIGVVSAHLQISDNQSKSLAPAAASGTQPSTAATNGTVTFTGSSATNAPALTFTVTGRK